MAESWKDLARQLIWEFNPQDNYHGTPYTFNKFDDSKFLTGEGAMAHGPGHYSADDIKVGEGYRIPTKRIYNKSIGKFVDINPNEYANKLTGWKLGDYLASYLEYSRDGVMPGDYVTTSTVGKNPLAMDIINNPENYDVRINKGNLYKVNVPNENFMWKEGLPLSEQTQYIRDAWYKNNFDYGKLLNDWSIDHDLEGIRLPNDKKFWKVYNKSIEHYGEIKPILKRIFSNQMQALDLPDQLKFLARSGNLDKLSEAMGGIKGIRATGNIDGPINVTFSGNNIRMANTPWQRFVNRIPKQTLGKMANKIITSPAFKSFIDASPALGVGLDYLEPLDIIRNKGKEKQQKIQKMFKDAGYEVEVQPDGTYLFKM